MTIFFHFTIFEIDLPTSPFFSGNTWPNISPAPEKWPSPARREVIRFLLSLPKEQRELLELAESYVFTMA